MVYMDTSAIVALIVPEPDSTTVARWYTETQSGLVSAVWCVTEFASALGIKQRTGQLDAQQAGQAWLSFERLVANDLELVPLDPAVFHRAASMAIDAGTALRAGDALHLACAEQVKARELATLDAVMARHAERLQIKLTALT